MRQSPEAWVQVVNYPTDIYRMVLLTCRSVILSEKQYNNGPSNSRKEWTTLSVLMFVSTHYTESDTHRNKIINGRGRF